MIQLSAVFKQMCDSTMWCHTNPDPLSLGALTSKKNLYAWCDNFLNPNWMNWIFTYNVIYHTSQLTRNVRWILCREFLVISLTIQNTTYNIHGMTVYCCKMKLKRLKQTLPIGKIVYFANGSFQFHFELISKVIYENVFRDLLNKRILHWLLWMYVVPQNVWSIKMFIA